MSDHTSTAVATPLGLVVADRIVRSHGGKIELLTKTGKGTLFRTIFSLSASMGGNLEALSARDALNPQRGGAYEETKS